MVEAAVVGGQCGAGKGWYWSDCAGTRIWGTAVHIGSLHVLTILAELSAKPNLRSVWVVCPERALEQAWRQIFHRLH